MAHGFLKSFDKRLEVFSGGTEASGKVNPKAIEVMDEIGIDISNHTSDSVSKYLKEKLDYVITVCKGANENCPVFTGEVENRLHIGFDDPSEAEGTEEFINSEYRRVRNEIKEKFFKLYSTEINPL